MMGIGQNTNPDRTVVPVGRDSHPVQIGQMKTSALTGYFIQEKPR